MTLRYLVPDDAPVVRCQKCGEEVVVVKKKDKVLFIGYKSVVPSRNDTLVGYEHRCQR
jgi:hypothetical protein